MCLSPKSVLDLARAQNAAPATKSAPQVAKVLRLPRKIDLRTRLREHCSGQHSETVANPHAEQRYPLPFSVLTDFTPECVRILRFNFSYYGSLVPSFDYGSFLTKFPFIKYLHLLKVNNSHSKKKKVLSSMLE